MKKVHTKIQELVKQLRARFPTKIHDLAERVRARFPKAGITLDPPERANGSWFLDVRQGKNAVVVEWRPLLGFGISEQGGEYGEGPDELIFDVDAAALRTIELLEASPPLLEVLTLCEGYRPLRDANKLLKAHKLVLRWQKAEGDQVLLRLEPLK
jgi:hypothetical protein